MTGLLLSLMVIIFNLIISGLNWYTDHSIELSFYQWLGQWFGFSGYPNVWWQFAIIGGFHILSYLLLFFLLRIEFKIGKKDQNHILYPFFNNFAKYSRNNKEVWPKFILIPITVLNAGFLYLLYKNEIDPALWWGLAIFLYGLWMNHLDKRAKRKKIFERSIKDLIPSKEGAKEEISSRLYPEICKEPWYHNQIVFRIPWPAMLSPTSSTLYHDVNNSFDFKDDIYGSDEFHQNVEKDQILSQISRKIISQESDTGFPKRFYQHQEEVISRISNRYDENNNPDHVLLVTPVGSGRTILGVIAAIRSILKENKNVLYVFKEPAQGRILAEEVINSIKKTEWEWAFTIVEYWSDQRFPKSSVEGKEYDLLGNPDLFFLDINSLHSKVLPNHGEWEHFIGGLGLIVVEGLDEYGGIMGANASYVFRRLRRIAHNYGVDPLILATSNVREGLESSFETFFNIPRKDFKTKQIVDFDGRGKKAKEILVWNTAIAHHDISNSQDTSILRQDALENDLHYLIAKILLLNRKPIVIQKGIPIVGSDISTTNTEILNLVQDKLGKDIEISIGENAEIISVSNGKARVTSPLDFDTVIITGFPGSWGKLMHELDHLGEHAEIDTPTIIILLPYTPMFQYLSRNFFKFISQSSTVVQVLPMNNPFILEAQIKATLAEIPGSLVEIERWFGQNAGAIISKLVEQEEVISFKVFEFDEYDTGKLQEVEKFKISNPEFQVKSSVAFIGENEWKVMDNGKEEGSLSEDYIGWQAYPRALIVMNQQRFQIDHIDAENRIINVFPIDQAEPFTTERVLQINNNDIRFQKDANTQQKLSRINYREGAGNVIYHVPVWIEINEQIIGYVRYKSYSYFNAGGAHEYAPFERKPFKTRAFVFSLPGASPSVLHTICHLLRSVIPFFLSEESLTMNVISLSKCKLVESKPAIMIYDAVRGGTGVADWFRDEENLKHVIEKSLDMLISCPCTEGCKGCVVIHNCNDFDFKKQNVCRNIDKLGTLKFLGDLLLEDVDNIIKHRKKILEKTQSVEAIRDNLVEYVFPHKLGIEIKDVAELSVTNEIPEGIDGIYYSGSNEVHVRPKREDRMITLLAHEYAHNWQWHGNEKMHPSLLDPDYVPYYNGKLFVEGFAQWVEYKVADFFGMHWVKDQIKFHHFNEYMEGFRILFWIEYQYRKEKGLGAGKVLEFIKTGKLIVEGEEISIEKMVDKSGVKASLKDKLKEFEKDPPIDDIEEEQVIISAVEVIDDVEENDIDKKDIDKKDIEEKGAKGDIDE